MFHCARVLGWTYDDAQWTGPYRQSLRSRGTSSAAPWSADCWVDRRACRHPRREPMRSSGQTTVAERGVPPTAAWLCGRARSRSASVARRWHLELALSTAVCTATRRSRLAMRTRNAGSHSSSWSEMMSPSSLPDCTRQRQPRTRPVCVSAILNPQSNLLEYLWQPATSLVRRART
jgi:hypothetical protein